MRFDLTDLRLFALTVEAGSITAGAERAHLSLPSASERLRGMEDAAGVILLERGRRGVTATRAGEVLYRHAMIMLRQAEHLRAELGEFAGGLTGKVRLLSNTAALTEFLPSALAPWLARNPHVDIDLRESVSRDIVRAVAAGSAEIGIVSGAVATGSLCTRPFGLDQLVLVVPREHPLAGLGQIAFRDALRHELVGLTTGSALQSYLEDQAERAGLVFRLRVRVRSFDDICLMVAHDAGLGIVSETAARRALRSLDIAFIRLEDSWARRQLLLCFQPPGTLAPAARNLTEHLAEAGVRATAP
ncbi:LysR substrate binding domain protein [Acetobacteraceae bacterium AT-5844]|nr:LysR substrate binding domain protein [Acetobacteraceae bacterium AT-5844]